MSTIDRRQFLKMAASLAAAMALGPASVPQIADALVELSSGQAPLLWLQAQSCSGCSVSLLNATRPDISSVLTQYVSLLFHSTISAATGRTAMDVLDKSIDHGGYYLAVEGSIPLAMPEACVIGGVHVSELVGKAAQNAKAILCVGTCAAYGGIPAADNNPTGSVSVVDFLKTRNCTTPLIRLPGCPSHPDWIVGTLVHVIKFGLPKLDADARPEIFYGRLLHDQCPRFADYERENFASSFSGDGCLFKLGCMGPVTKADCNSRLWNRGANTCIHAGAPCIGCASDTFAKSAALPFYRKGEKN